MNQKPDDELKILPTNRVDSTSLQDEATLLEAKELVSDGRRGMANRNFSKVGRSIVVALVVLMIAIVFYAVVRLMTPPEPVTDANGCVWDEISVLQAAHYASDAKKNYKTKTEHGKTYLLRECNQLEATQ